MSRSASRLLDPWFPLACLALALAACSDDPVATSEPVDPAGVWNFSFVVTQANGTCADDVGESAADPVTITKTGSAPPYGIVASGFLGDPANVLTGTFSANNRLLLSGSYPEDGGTTTASHDLLATSQNQMQGIESWSWTGPGGSCPDGEANVVANRIP